MDLEDQDSSNRHTPANVRKLREFTEKAVIQSAIIWTALNLHYTLLGKDGNGSIVPLALMFVFNWLWNFL